MDDSIMEWMSFFVFIGGLTVFTASIFAVYKAADTVLGATLLKAHPRLAGRVAVGVASLWMLAGISTVTVLATVASGGV